MQDTEKLEEIAMLIIANSGAGRSSAFEALEKAKAGKFDEADALMQTAEEQLHSAHEAHRELLKMDASGQVEQVTILLSHAQDHLMAGTLAKELIFEIILLRRELQRK